MFKKIVSISALALALAACESTSDHGHMADGTYDGHIVPGSREHFAQIKDRVHFATNSSHLTADSKSTIHKQAAWLKEYPCDATVEGHCDERGTSAYNLALGERRAAAKKAEMVGQGVPADSIETVSYGKERPHMEGHDEGSWSQNRRAVTGVNPSDASYEHNASYEHEE